MYYCHQFVIAPNIRESEDEDSGSQQAYNQLVLDREAQPIVSGATGASASRPEASASGSQESMPSSSGESDHHTSAIYVVDKKYAGCPENPIRKIIFLINISGFALFIFSGEVCTILA